MEGSLIYDMLVSRLSKYREELEAEENYSSEAVKNSLSNLENLLNEEQLKLVSIYKNDILMQQELIELNFGIRVTNLAVRIGMQLQRALDMEEF